MLTRADSVLNTYVTACKGALSPEQKEALKLFLRGQSAAAGGDGALAERWGVAADELRVLRKSVE